MHQQVPPPSAVPLFCCVSCVPPCCMLYEVLLIHGVHCHRTDGFIVTHTNYSQGVHTLQQKVAAFGHVC